MSSFGVDWFVDNILFIIFEDIFLFLIIKGMIIKEDGEMINYL